MRVSFLLYIYMNKDEPNPLWVETTIHKIACFNWIYPRLKTLQSLTCFLEVKRGRKEEKFKVKCIKNLQGYFHLRWFCLHWTRIDQEHNKCAFIAEHELKGSSYDGHAHLFTFQSVDVSTVAVDSAHSLYTSCILSILAE